MATTAQTIIDRAMRLIGALESGESPTADETADALIALNQMIDSWRNDRLIAYKLTNHTLTLVNGDNTYTIGSGGDINTTRPVKIDSAFVTEGGIDYPVEIIGKSAFDAISDKTTQSNLPSRLYYDPAYPTANIKLYPTPSTANVLTVSVWEPIGTFATAATSISLPPGYERALTYNLACEIAPEFQQPVPPKVEQNAIDSLAAIKRINVTPIIAQVEFAMGRRSDIESDQ